MTFHTIKKNIIANGKVHFRAFFFRSVCLHCRQLYGEHFGKECPNPITLQRFLGVSERWKE